MAMKYHDQFKDMFENDSNWRSLFPYRTILNNPPIAQVLKQNGYTYNQVSSWWDFTRLRVKADTSYAKSFRLNLFGATFYLSDLQRDILHKSILSPWLKKGMSAGTKPIVKYDLDRNPQENFNAELSSLESIASKEDKTKPNFTFAHILAPHPPYVFDKNGNWPTYDNEANDNGVAEKTKYTNELTYINTRIENLIADIRKNSPNAIVFIQADEGPYPSQFRGDMTPERYYDPNNLSLSEMKQKFSIMASYYMPGQSAEEVKKINSSVNVFPFILNHYLNYNLPMLPDCQFAMGNKFNVYNYQLVSDKIKNQPADPACKNYE
jgi:membrane-anchored protein YejM (alkaline phosphatase superfamily)